MNEDNNLSAFANDYRAFTSIQQVPDYRSPQSRPVEMADVGSTIFVACSAIAIAFAVRKTLQTQEFKTQRAAFKRMPVVVRSAFTSLLVAVIAYGGAKPGTNEMERASSPLAVLMSSGEQMASIPEAVQLTENQQLAGFALTAVVTNETFDLSAPTNAVVHANWLKRGAAEDGFWVPVGTFCLGTNHYDSVYVSSSGTLSFNHPKSSAVAHLIPDGSSIAFLAPLQTVLGLPPEANWNLLSATNSLFWHDVTTYGSARFTWQNALLNRATNAPLSFQAELLPTGDFIYRYDFSSITNYESGITNYVVGAQNNGGGETALIATESHSCSGTNHLCALLYRLDGTNVTTTPLCSVATNSPKFSLYWTAFGEFDPTNPDPDDDGITTPDEVLIHHTDPHMPDSDLDGVSDGDELAIGTNPLDPDGDNDGIPDGLDVQPLVWNDADDDTDGDGLSLAEELLQGLDPAVADDIDTDGDGWEDWKEALAATSPTDFNDSPVNEDGSTKIFDVTIASGSMSGASVLLAVGDHRMIFGASATSYTLTLREGIAHPVSLYAATDCSAALTYTLGSSYAVFRNPHPLFSGVGTLSGGRIALSGMIAQPVPSIDPDPLCFHTRDDIHVEASVLPEGMTGNWSWWMACEPWTGEGNEVDLPYDDIDYPTYFESGFLAHGAASSRWVARTVTRCALLDEHPEWLESDFDPVPPYPAEEPLGDSETGGPGFDAYGSELLIPVNNDDDNANESLDTADGEMSVADNDLVGYYPLGYFTGQCCPCPEHQVRYADTATLLSSSSHLALYADPGKTNAFTGPIHAGEILYVEGLSESASVGAEEIVWQYTGGGQTHQLTNLFTVLSQRIFGDLDFDEDIDTADKALHCSLSTTNGWVMPVATNVFRMTQLQTDVDLPGIHTLSLSGDAFRVWQSANPSTNDAPLLVSGQTVTNGVNGVSWGMNHTANVYIQAITNGTATLTYSYIGTGSASGIVCRVSMKLTAFPVNIDGDYDHDGTPEDHPFEADGVLFTNSVGMVILPNNNDNTNDNTPNVDCEDSVVNGAADLPDIYPLFISKIGVPVDAMPDGLTFELRVSGTGDDPAGAPEPKERVRIFASRTADAVGIIGPGTLPESIVFAKHPATNQLDIALLAGGGHLELGIEGIEHGMPVEVVFRAWINGEEVSHDAVCVLNAPFLVLANTDKATKAYVANASGWQDFYDETSTALNGVVTVVEYGAKYTQDYAEIGASQSASGQTVRKRCIIAGLYWPEYLDQVASDTSYFNLQVGNVGGNIEASPPIQGYPHGRLIVGSSLPVNAKEFLRAQKIQTDGGNIMELPVGWLGVGHVDEVMTIVPVGSSFKVLVADLQLAIDLLQSNSGEETFGGFDSRAQILSTYSNNPARVAAIISNLADVRNALAQGLGMDENDFIRVPVAFKVVVGGPSDTVLPNMINMIVVKNPSGVRRLVIPEPFFNPFFIDLGVKLNAKNYQNSEVYTVDTREPHDGGGEAHCASNVRRELP